MRTYDVEYAPEFRDRIKGLYLHIAHEASPVVAENYTAAIVSYCDSLGTFPHRGVKREDLQPGMRITHYKGRAVIAFAVDDEAGQVSIIDLFYGGQDYETALRERE